MTASESRVLSIKPSSDNSLSDFLITTSDPAKAWARAPNPPDSACLKRKRSLQCEIAVTALASQVVLQTDIPKVEASQANTVG